ncbi:17212_t:CDS:1 [Dentiscutata erythropus]|uniref:17212_t:CDS:1 n=1 Tax=Dentiscutata erythropus TaxID=1348616 RepID=A0A9N8ZBW4_9GLOM|nr:17212_t:CDS:1 [Dentiscutata erythropus]
MDAFHSKFFTKFSTTLKTISSNYFHAYKLIINEVEIIVEQTRGHNFRNKLYYSKAQIYEAAVREIYTYCKVIFMDRVVQSFEMARNAKEGISVLKTTMIVKSHWRLIKHNYLHKFNKPRVDLLMWVLAERLIPRYSIKFQRL